VIAVALITVAWGEAVGREDLASVVILSSGNSTPYREVMEGFQRYLEQHHPSAVGDVYTLSDGDRDKALDRLRRDPPSVLLTLGSQPANLALTEVPNVPLVAAMIVGMAAIRQAPNATGVSLEFPLETSLTWLRRILPDTRSVGVLYDPTLNEQTVDAAERLASSLHLSLESEVVATPRDLRSAMDQLGRRVDVFWGIPDATVLSPQTARQVLLFSFRQQIPLVGLSAEWVKAGALYALERDYRDVGAQAGGLAVKILRGTPPRALPPQTPRTVLYDINLKTAQRLRSRCRRT
jgi:putative ABC transport system substrate-binding protein